MRLIVTGLVIIAIAGLILAALRLTRTTVVPAGEVKKPETLETKLGVLAKCGLRLAQPFRIDDLLASWDRTDYEKEGYNLVLVGLGMTEEKEPWRNHCLNLWHFDTECIEDHGDYKRIADRFVEMAEGSLPLENIRDYVDVERKKAWLSFTFRGNETKIDCKVEDDWVDERVFETFVDVLKQADPSKIFIYYNLGGQDCIIGCVTREQYRCLKTHDIGFEALK
ncbi:MAG TPA: hypothetical protein VNS63_10900 [Blastocatellia bacterium]|nr:hypothetical protein [Blastocatellia bacterium]